MPITHIGNALFICKGSSSKYRFLYIALRDILLVPSITKNLLSISKLTADNNLSVKFCGNVCFIKDILKGQVILQGNVEKVLYRQLLKSSSSSHSQNSSALFLSQLSSTKPLSILSCCHFKSAVNNIASQKSCNHTAVFFCNAINNKAILFHKRFGHPNHQVLLHILKNIKSVSIPSHHIQ